MTFRVILISPDPGLTAKLCEALSTDEANAEATPIGHYPTPSELSALVNSDPKPVTAFIVGLSDQDKALSLIRDLRVTYTESLAVAASVSSSADTILAAMRAGASEFLVPPFDVAQLRSALQKHGTMVTSTRTAVNGRLMCLLPAQGGNGASTLAVHLASTIARITSEKVLLIDYDFHCGTVAFRLRLKPDYSFADAVARIGDIDELWERITSIGKNVDILAAPPPGTAITTEAMRNVSAIFSSARRTYPFTLIDFPSALHTSCRDVLSMADSVYLIATPEVVSLHLARRRVGELMNLGVSNQNIHLILNRVGSKKTLNVDDVSEVVGVPVFSSIPNDYGVVSDASLKGGLVPDESRLGRQVTALATTIIGTDETSKGDGKTEKGGKWKGFLKFS